MIKKTIFHTPEWKQIIEKTYGYEPVYLSKDNGMFPLFYIKTTLTNKLLSLPFSFAAGPVGDNEIMDALLTDAKKIYQEKKCNLLEIRMQNKLPEDLVSKHELKERFENYVSILDISKGADHIWNNMDRKHRNAVRKSEKDGIIVEEINSKEKLKTYFDLKTKLSAKKHGIPAEPMEFYNNMWDILASKNMVKIFYAKYAGKIIGGVILFLHKDEALYVSGAADEKYLSHQPYNALLWNAIKWCCENNYKIFNFGISSVKNEGLLAFKKKWGTENFKVPTYYYGDISEGGDKLLFKKIWSKIPVSISKIMGKHLVKQKGG